MGQEWNWAEWSWIGLGSMGIMWALVVISLCIVASRDSRRQEWADREAEQEEEAKWQRQGS